MKRLAVITTHPIQYNAPLFRLLTSRNRLSVKVFYTWSQAKEEIYDPGFGHHRKWDLPLLEGYDHCFIENTAKSPGSHHFMGIINPGLTAELQAWQPDALLVFGWSFHSHLICLRYFKNRIPVFFRGDSTLLDEKGGLRTWLRRSFLTWVYSHIDKAFYTGQNSKAYFLAHGIKAENLVWAPHAVENERFSAPGGKAAGSELRSSLGLHVDDFVVLFAGKLEEKKNPCYLLQLAKEIKDPSVKFLFVGNGHLENELKKATEGEKRFCFLTFQNQSAMPAVYHAADCFLLPSTGPGESWGLAANEAMAAGRPVLLSSKAGGAVDLVDGNGIVFNPADVGPVADCIRALKANPSYVEEACRLSTERVKRFSLEAVAEAVEKEVLRTGAEPDHREA